MDLAVIRERSACSFGFVASREDSPQIVLDILEPGKSCDRSDRLNTVFTLKKRLFFELNLAKCEKTQYNP